MLNKLVFDAESGLTRSSKTFKEWERSHVNPGMTSVRWWKSCYRNVLRAWVYTTR